MPTKKDKVLRQDGSVEEITEALWWEVVCLRRELYEAYAAEESSADERDEEFARKEAALDKRERDLALRERDLAAGQKSLAERTAKLRSRQKDLDRCEEALRRFGFGRPKPKPDEVDLRFAMLEFD